MTPEQKQALIDVADATWDLDEEARLEVLTEAVARVARTLMDRCECSDEEDVAERWDYLATKAFSAVTILESVIKEF